MQVRLRKTAVIISSKHMCPAGANGLHAREYKRDIAYKESIQQFMDDIASADYIVLLISDKYLKK